MDVRVLPQPLEEPAAGQAELGRVRADGGKVERTVEWAEEKGLDDG